MDVKVYDGMRKRLINERRPTWFEELYNQDVASREVEATPDTARVPQMNSARGNVVPKNVTKDGLVEMINGPKKALENGFKEIHEKFDVMDTRLKSMEEYVNFERKKEKWVEDVQNQGFEKQNVDGDEENEKKVGEKDEEDETGSNEKDEENETEVGDKNEKDETETGEKDEENEMKVGEKDQENKTGVGEKEKKMKEAGEDGGKRMRAYERKRTRKGRRGKKQEGEPSGGGGKRRKKVAVAVKSPVMTRQKKKNKV